MQNRQIASTCPHGPFRAGTKSPEPLSGPFHKCGPEKKQGTGFFRLQCCQGTTGAKAPGFAHLSGRSRGFGSARRLPSPATRDRKSRLLFCLFPAEGQGAGTPEACPRQPQGPVQPHSFPWAACEAPCVPQKKRHASCPDLTRLKTAIISGCWHLLSTKSSSGIFLSPVLLRQGSKKVRCPGKKPGCGLHLCAPRVADRGGELVPDHLSPRGMCRAGLPAPSEGARRLRPWPGRAGQRACPVLP